MKAFKPIFLSVAVLAAPAFADDAPSLWAAKCKSCHAENGNGDTKTGREKKIEDLTAALNN